MTLADIIIPLCGSISNERAQKIREACDMQERRVEALEKRVEALSLDVAILVEGTVEAVHEAGLRTLAQRVEALEQIRISHEADYSKSASVLADRIEALDRALSAAAEDNGDLDVRVPALERASAKNTGEGHGVAGSTPAGPSRSTTMPSTASPAGNVPSWVPSADEIQQFIDDGREGDLRSLIASRAPRPSPQPSVEELARKIAARIYGDDGQYVEPQHHAWQAAEVALAALSAMPASEELTDAEAQRLYDDAAKDAKPFGDHEVERFVRVTVDPQAEVLALQKQRNDVYEERDRLVAALSKCFPSWLARHPDSDKGWDDDWRWIVFVQLPTGQATWHIHDRELAWFDHLEVRENSWDGHTTEEKYRRLELLRARILDDGLASRTPASKEARKACDEMLSVFANDGDHSDDEDCWTQPARLAVQYVSDLEWDLETHVNRSAILAETNDTLRGFIDCLAAFTGTHFGADEPLKNYERVRKALTDKPEPPAPSPQAQGEVCECGHPWSEHVDGDDAERHARRYGWTCVEDGCECAAIPSKPLPAPAESAPAQDGEPTLEDCQRAAIEATRKLHPNASDLALLLSPDEAAQVAAVRALCLASRARDASWRIEVRGSQPQCWVVVDPSGDAGEQSFTVGPCFDEDEREDAEHFARMTRVALERMSIRLPSPALAAIVEAGDAMQNAGHLLRTSCYQVQVTPEARMWDDALAAYDRARAALPKDGA